MKITEVTVRKIEKENSRKRGIAHVKIDDCFMIHDITILEGDSGLYISMPRRMTSTGKYKDIAHPINQETRKMFEDAIFEAYKNAE